MHWKRYVRATWILVRGWSKGLGQELIELRRGNPAVIASRVALR